MRIEPPPISVPFQTRSAACRADARIGVEISARCREGMVQSVPPLGFLAPLEHREVDDPHQVVPALARPPEPKVPEHARGHRRRVRHHEDRVALAGAGLHESGDLLLGEELGDG